VVFILPLLIFLSESASADSVIDLFLALLFDSLQVHLEHKLTAAAVTITDVKVAVEDFGKPFAHV
jgi:hypothetical protein